MIDRSPSAPESTRDSLRRRSSNRSRGIGRLARTFAARVVAALPFATLAQIAAALLVSALGCSPTQPVYLKRTDDALAHYIDTATRIEYPDHTEPPSSEALHSSAPVTLNNPEVGTYWELTLEDCVSISLQNSKILRNNGIASLSSSNPLGQLARTPAGFSSVYDPAIVESDPNFGVEGALAEFDAQFNSTFNYGTTDRPQNFGFFQPFQVQRQANFLADLSKRSATGTTTYLRTTTDYLWSNNTAQSVPSAYTTTLEMGVNQPLLRGAGTQINRAPIVIARLQVDQSLADFEAQVRDHVLAVETSYWNLYQNYRVFETAKTSSESVLASWQTVNARYLAELEPDRTEAQARSQYYAFRALTEDAYRVLLNEESNLRLLMGLAPNDGRVIRPGDQPPQSYVAFDWDACSAEALVRLPEIRRTKWAIKQRELELVVARNQLLPNLNATALYRWVGVGDELIRSSQSARFPAPGSNAVGELLVGDFQEFGAGFEFNFPIGFRRELAGVRNTQLILAREKARLEEQELAAMQALSVAFRNLDVQYQVLQTSYNQVLAADRELESAKRYFEAELAPQGVRTTIDLVLDAERRRADALRTFYTTQAEYARAIAAVHYAKGSILEYDNVALEEGPWPRKAYWDAMGHARRQAASHYIDYGFTRPNVVSQGELEQEYGTTSPLPDPGGASPPPSATGTPTPAPANGTMPESGVPGAPPADGGDVRDRGVPPVRTTDPLAAGRKLRRLPSARPSVGTPSPRVAQSGMGSLPERFSGPRTSSVVNSPAPYASPRSHGLGVNEYPVQPAGWQPDAFASPGVASSGSPASAPSAVAAPPAKKGPRMGGPSVTSTNRRWTRYLDADPLPLRDASLPDDLLDR